MVNDALIDTFQVEHWLQDRFLSEPFTCMRSKCVITGIMLNSTLNCLRRENAQNCQFVVDLL